MAFAKLPNTVGRPAIRGDRVAASVLKNGQIRIVLSNELANKTGLGNRCEVKVGVGSDAGRILLSSASRNGGTHFCKPEGNSQRRLMVLASRIGVSEAHRGITSLDFDISDDGLVIDVRPLMKPVAVRAAA